MNGSVKHFTVTGRAHRAGKTKSQNPAATDAAMRGAAQRRTSTAHWSRRSMRRSRSRGFLGQASLTACGSVRWPEVWRGVGEIQARRTSTQAQSSPSRRGVESVKFGCDFFAVSKSCHENWTISQRVIRQREIQNKELKKMAPWASLEKIRGRPRKTR